MTGPLTLVPVVVMIGVLTLFVKLSALIARLRLSWVHSLLFALILSVVLVAARMVGAAAHVAPSSLAWLLSAVVLNLLLGGWFLRARARRANGEPAGVPGGMRLSAVMLVISGGAALVLMSIQR
jgi:hypothetical protein